MYDVVKISIGAAWTLHWRRPALTWATYTAIVTPCTRTYAIAALAMMNITGMSAVVDLSKALFCVTMRASFETV